MTFNNFNQYTMFHKLKKLASNNEILMTYVIYTENITKQRKKNNENI